MARTRRDTRPRGLAAALLLVLIVGPTSTAAADPLWVRTVDGGPFDAGVGSFVEATADGGVVLLARSDGTLLKLDAQGEIVWHRTPSTGAGVLTALYHAVATSGGVVLVGQVASADRTRGFMLEVDPATGRFGPVRLLGCDEPGASTTLRSISPTLAGGFVLAGDTNCFGMAASHLWIVRVDALWSIEWQRAYQLTVDGVGGVDTPGFAFEQADGTYVVVGGTTARTGGTAEMVVLSLSDAGDVATAAIWPGILPPETAIELADGRVLSWYSGGYTAVDLLTVPLPLPVNQRIFLGGGRLSATRDGGILAAGSYAPAGRAETDLTIVREGVAGIDARTAGDPGREVAESGVAACETADGGVVAYALEGGARILVARLDKGLDLAPGCDHLQPFDAGPLGIWDSPVRVVPAVRVVAGAEAIATVPSVAVDVAAASADACFASAECSTDMAIVRGVLAVRSGDDVVLSWREDLAANGYNVWTVAEKGLIDQARQAGSPPPAGVDGCSVPAAAPAAYCSDVGGVSRDVMRFYQVRAHCDAATEGP